MVVGMLGLKIEATVALSSFEQEDGKRNSRYLLRNKR